MGDLASWGWEGVRLGWWWGRGLGGSEKGGGGREGMGWEVCRSDTGKGRGGKRDGECGAGRWGVVCGVILPWGWVMGVSFVCVVDSEEGISFDSYGK